MQNIELQELRIELGGNGIGSETKRRITPSINASLVLLYGLLASEFIIGWITLNSCPLSRMIPIYLIVSGTCGILTKCLSGRENKFLYGLSMVLLLFDLVWHLLGTYWIYKEYQPNYDPEHGIYCNRTAYLLAFWSLTIQYTLLGLFIMLSMCYILMRGDFENK